MQAALGPTTRRPSSNSVPLAPEEQAQVAAEKFEREHTTMSSESPALFDDRVAVSAGDHQGDEQESTPARVIESNAESFRKSDDNIDPGH